MLQTLSLRAQRWAVVRLSFFAGRRRRAPAHLLVGERGEQEAFFYLRQIGYTIAARRWCSGRHRGDLDLVAWENDVLCIVEVKTRSRQDAMDPAEAAVDRHKRDTLRRLAGAYIRQLPAYRRDTVPLRFDILSVYLPAEGALRPPVFELCRGAFGRKERQRRHVPSF